MDLGFRAHQPLAAIPARSASGPYQAAAVMAATPATYGNGRVVLQGSATIGASASWHDGKQTTDRFFKTVLRFK